jgi:hypothetical protein
MEVMFTTSDGNVFGEEDNEDMKGEGRRVRPGERITYLYR